MGKNDVPIKQRDGREATGLTHLCDDDSYDDELPAYTPTPDWSEIETSLVRKTVDRRREMKLYMKSCETEYINYALAVMRHEIWREASAAARKGNDKITLQTATLDFAEWMGLNHTTWVNDDDNHDMYLHILYEVEESINVQVYEALQQAMSNWSVRRDCVIYDEHLRPLTEQDKKRASCKTFTISWSANAAKLYNLENSKTAKQSARNGQQMSVYNNY